MSGSALPKRTVSEADLDRLKAQREAADSRYDEALTAVDQGLFGSPEFPHPPPFPDETQVTPLNTRWDILRVRPADPPGWRGRLAREVWALVDPMLAEQQAFNSLLVDHINRNIQPQREVARSIESTIAVLRDHIARLVTFHSTLLQYLQRLTPFVNSKDYEFAALARRTAEDGQQEIQSLARTQRALSAALQGLSNELLKQVESLRSQVQRYDGRIETVNAAIAIVQQQAAALQRALASPTFAPTSPTFAPTSPIASVGKPVAPVEPVAPVSSSTLAGDSAVESWKYPAFEAAFRGSEEDIAARLSDYAEIFAGAQDVLDVGCGRGEFLDALRERGITARGIDLNFEMVELCRQRGLDVAHGDVLSYLKGLPDGALGGLFAAQVVEHLTPDYLLAFLNEAQRVLRAGAPLVLETINVACWYAFFQSYVRDITHARPLHPDTLKYLVIASGFAHTEVQFRVPVADADKLQHAPEIAWRPSGEDKDAIRSLAQTVDDNADLLNRLLFTTLDYAVTAKRA